MTADGLLANRIYLVSVKSIHKQCTANVNIRSSPWWRRETGSHWWRSRSRDRGVTSLRACERCSCAPWLSAAWCWQFVGPRRRADEMTRRRRSSVDWVRPRLSALLPPSASETPPSTSCAYLSITSPAHVNQSVYQSIKQVYIAP